MIPRLVAEKIKNDAAGVEFVARRVRDTLQAYCVENHYVFDGRSKSPDSLAEKIETGRFRGWSELDDLYACTIAVPLPADEPQVLDFLTTTFTKIQIKLRLAAQKAPDVFRFDSTRFIGTLRRPEGGEGGAEIFGIRFEVQIKSLFELAWSRTTHALAYKAARVDWRALRLAASLKASVEQMDLLLSDYENAMKQIGRAPWRELDRKQAIQDKFLSLQALIPPENWPKDFSRFVQNCYSLIELLQRSFRRQSKDRRADIHDDCLTRLEQYVRANQGNAFPRSISLFQLVLAVLTQAYQLAADEDVWFPISDELEMLFPHAKTIKNRFDFG